MVQHATHFDDSNRIIFIRIEGKLKTKGAREMGLKIRQIAKDKSYGIIFDYRKADPSGITTLDIDNTFSDAYDKIDKELRNVPVVLLFDPKKFARLAKFVDLSWTAQGIATITCSDEDKGRAWLAKQLN